MNNRPTYINNGTLRVNDTNYRIDTYYPAGFSKPEHRMICVWQTIGESFTFTSENSFLDWLDAQQSEGAQRALF
jgi:hypothetical protein